MKFSEHIYKTEFRERDVDLLGHVTNAAYPILFDEARWDMITAGGFGVATIKSLNMGPVILKVTMTFKKEVAARQPIQVRTIVTDYSSKVGQIIQSVLNEKGEECCVAEYHFGLFDITNRKLIAATPEWLKAMRILPTEDNECWRKSL